jgi:hypothetical protein
MNGRKATLLRDGGGGIWVAVHGIPPTDNGAINGPFSPSQALAYAEEWGIELSPPSRAPRGVYVGVEVISTQTCRILANLGLKRSPGGLLNDRA